MAAMTVDVLIADDHAIVRDALVTLIGRGQ